MRQLTMWQLTVRKLRYGSKKKAVSGKKGVRHTKPPRRNRCIAGAAWCVVRGVYVAFDAAGCRFQTPVGSDITPRR